MPTRPNDTPAALTGIRPRDSTELADILAYRMREHLGPTGDYYANLIPNRLAIQVVMRAPEELRGFSFIFTGGDLPLPIRTLRNGMPEDALLPPFTVPLVRDVNLEVNAIYDEVNRVTDGMLGPNPNPAMDITRLDATTYANINRANYPTWAAMTGVTTGGTMAATIGNPTAGVNAPAAIGVRTPEQEVRYQALEAESNNVIFTPTQAEEYHRLRRLQACPTTAPPITTRPAPRLRVRVWRDDYSQWQVTVRVDNGSRELPTVAVIKALLPPGDKHFLPSRQGRHRGTLYILRNALSAGLPAQSLHDALRAWVVASESAATSVQSDEPILDDSTTILLNAMPATLEVGGKVYRLVPTRELDARPLIKRVREKALTLAKMEATAIRGRATTDARVVVQEAENRSRDLRMEIERERAALGTRAPEWVVRSGRAHRWNDGYWYVEMRVLCQVREIRYTVSSWNRVLHWNPINPRETSYYDIYRMPVWVRIREEGRYTKDDISCKGPYCCTHIDSYMCMDLQGLPLTLTSGTQITNLESIIGRGMQVVNLNSPLNTSVRKYWPAFLEQLPPIPIKLMTSGERADRYIIPNGRTVERWQAENPSITWDRSELIEQEQATIFHVGEVGNATPR